MSDKGCTAGKSCKWQRSCESLPDKAERCWICGSKEHRKNDCRLKSSTTKKLGEPSGSGGGTGHGRGGSGNDASGSTSNSTTTAIPSSNVGGKAGAAAAKVLQGNDPTSSTTTSLGETKNGSTGGKVQAMVELVVNKFKKVPRLMSCCEKRHSC